MKYLDEEIYCKTATNVTLKANGTTPYTIYQCPIDIDNGTSIFIGNYYSTSGSAKVRIRMNDYISCYKNVAYEALADQDTTNTWLVSYDDEPPVMKYYFEINGVKSDVVYVCRGFRYPNRLKRLEKVNDTTDYFHYSINLQGETLSVYEDTQELYFKPHYPYKSGLDVFVHIPICSYYGNEGRSLTALEASDGSMTFKTMNEDIYNTTFLYRLSCNKDYYGKNITKDTELSFIGVDDGDRITIYKGFGVFDACPAKYYLLWQDRLGGTQCQGFDGTSTFTMEYERNTYTKYNNEKILYNTGMSAPVFKINSGWLNDNVMPFYESIFVSPYLQLIDVENNKIYDVLLKDTEYTEKTFNNQGNQLFNLSLELELNKNQKLVW